MLPNIRFNFFSTVYIVYRISASINDRITTADCCLYRFQCNAESSGIDYVKSHEAERMDAVELCNGG